MYRFAYKNFLLTEENIDKCIDKYVALNQLEKDCVISSGFKAYRLTSSDSVIEILFNHKAKTIYLDTDIDICKENGLKIISFLEREKVLRYEYPGCPSSLKECNEKMIKYLASVISGTRQPEFPVIYLSRQDRHSYAGNVDEYSLATKLQGIAHVVIESSESVCFDLKREISSKKFWPPSKGEIGIYFPDGSHNIITPKDRTSSSFYNCESFIVHLVVDAITKKEKMRRPTFDKIALKKSYALQNNIIATQGQDSIKDCLDSERKANSELKKRNEALLSDNVKLKTKLKSANSPAKEITFLRIPDMDEGREREFYDLIVAALKAYKNMLPNDKKRAKKILDELLLLNPETDYEKNMFIDLSRSFKSENEIEATLKKYNIHIPRNKNHTICEYMGITQPLSCTPGDWRTERNQLKNIKLAFCVQ